MKKIGLILGPGGGKGFAHLGVLEVLQEHGITPSYVIGVSIGSLVGSVFCKYGDYKKTRELLLDFNWRGFSSLLCSNPRRGVLDGRKFRNQMNLFLENADFKDLQIPFEAVATNISTSQPAYFNKGNVAEAVQASAAFPVLIEPLRKQEGSFWDGAMSDPLPVKRAREKADVVLAVNLSKYPEVMEKNQNMSPFKAMRTAVNSLQYQLTLHCAKEADVLLEPEVGGEGILNISLFLREENRAEIMRKGREEAESKIDLIKEKIGD